MNPGSSGQKLFGALRPFVRQPAPAERCDLCSANLGAVHAHLMEVAKRRLLCCCEPCALLFSGPQNTPYRRVPRGVQGLADFRLSDALWGGLNIPINLAFCFPSTVAGRVVAMYPSPAGATEALLPPSEWHDLVEANPVLGELEPDVEALLVNRLGEPAVYYRAPIDECYKLVGLVRTRWHGLSGGTEVWKEIARFFADLETRSATSTEAGHA